MLRTRRRSILRIHLSKLHKISYSNAGDVLSFLTEALSWPQLRHPPSSASARPLTSANAGAILLHSTARFSIKPGCIHPPSSSSFPALFCGAIHRVDDARSAQLRLTMLQTGVTRITPQPEVFDALCIPIHKHACCGQVRKTSHPFLEAMMQSGSDYAPLTAAINQFLPASRSIAPHPCTFFTSILDACCCQWIPCRIQQLHHLPVFRSQTPLSRLKLHNALARFIISPDPNTYQPTQPAHPSRLESTDALLLATLDTECHIYIPLDRVDSPPHPCPAACKVHLIAELGTHFRRRP